ncbi:MAG: methyl-accepting chemotaxis protein [Syntrophobacteraceae bacterium]
MKLRTKLVLGFAAVLCVMIALGALGTVMFKQVGTNMGVLAERSLPALQSSAAVEREALKTLLHEKEYLLSKSEEAGTRTMKSLQTLSAQVAEFSQIASKSGDADAASRAAEVRKLTAEYTQLLDQTIADLRMSSKAELSMDEKGALARTIANELMESKKAEYTDAKNALAIINNVNAWALDMRLSEKSFALEQGQQHLNAIKRNVASLLKAFEQLERLKPNETEKKQIANARVATEDYSKAILAWAEGLKQGGDEEALKANLKIMNRAGDTLSQVVEDYTLVKQGAVDKSTDSVFTVREIAETVLVAQLAEKRFIIGRDAKNWDVLKQCIDGLAALYKKLQGMVTNPTDKQRVENAAQATEQYWEAAKSWAQNQREVTENVLPKMKSNGEQVLASAQKTQDNAWNELDSVKASTQSIVSSSSFMIVVALAIGILVGAILAFLITRSITRPIQLVINGLAEGALQVSTAAEQVSASSGDLAEGSSEQAAAVEQTSSSLEEMASMTKQNADNASHASRLISEANQIVGEANASFAKLTHSMAEISSASEETQKIIKTIDEIAFQTNLLALNAAVEAARAGEAGAGFAVVADEVRNLAMRAAEASRNTAGLIEDTVKRVKEGSSLLATTDDEFKKVATSVLKSTELLNEIAVASQEQAQGIEQINRAVSEMDKVIQRNAATAEESASASEVMSSQADQMKGYVTELITMVGSHSRKDSLGHAPQLPPGAADTVRRLEGAKPVSDMTLEDHGKVNRISKALPPAGVAPNPKRPESVIPFDDDF